MTDCNTVARHVHLPKAYNLSRAVGVFEAVGSRISRGGEPALESIHSFLHSLTLTMTKLSVFIAAVLLGCAVAQSDLTGTNIVHMWPPAPHDLQQDMSVTWFALTLQMTFLWRHSFRFSNTTSHCKTSAPTSPLEVSGHIGSMRVCMCLFCSELYIVSQDGGFRNSPEGT